jgi:hypothetical protein
MVLASSNPQPGCVGEILTLTIQTTNLLGALRCLPLHQTLRLTHPHHHEGGKMGSVGKENGEKWFNCSPEKSKKISMT